MKNKNKICVQKTTTLVTECWIHLTPLVFVCPTCISNRPQISIKLMVSCWHSWSVQRGLCATVCRSFCSSAWMLTSLTVLITVIVLGWSLSPSPQVLLSSPWTLTPVWQRENDDSQKGINKVLSDIILLLTIFFFYKIVQLKMFCHVKRVCLE